MTKDFLAASLLPACLLKEGMEVSCALVTFPSLK